MAGVNPAEIARRQELQKPEARQMAYEQAQKYAAGELNKGQIADLQLSLRAMDITQPSKGLWGTITGPEKVKTTGQKDSVTDYAANELVQRYERDQRVAQIPGNGPAPAAATAASASAQNQTATPAEPAKPAAPKPDEKIQKFQSYYKGLTNNAPVDVDGQSQQIEVDGIESPATRAALVKYKKDNNMPEDSGIDAVNAKMEEQIKDVPPAVAQFSQDTMADGNNSPPGNITALQLILNFLSTLFGGNQLKVDGIIGDKTMQAFSDVNQDRKGALTGESLPGRGGPEQAAPDRAASADIVVQPGKSQSEINVAPGQETPAMASAGDVDPRTVQTINVDPTLAFNNAADQPPSGGPTKVLDPVQPAAAPSQTTVLQNPPQREGIPLDNVQLGRQSNLPKVYNEAASHTAPPEHYGRQRRGQSPVQEVNGEIRNVTSTMNSVKSMVNAAGGIQRSIARLGR